MFLLNWWFNSSRTTTPGSPPEKSYLIQRPGSGFSGVHGTRSTWVHRRIGLQQDKYKIRKGGKLVLSKESAISDRGRHATTPLPLRNGLLHHQKANFRHQLQLKTKMIMKLTPTFQFITSCLCLTLWSDQARPQRTTKDTFHPYQERPVLLLSLEKLRPAPHHLLPSEFPPPPLPSMLMSSGTPTYRTGLRKPENQKL